MEKYEAEIDVDGYWNLGERMEIIVSIPSLWTDGVCLREQTEINFGTYIRPYSTKKYATNKS